MIKEVDLVYTWVDGEDPVRLSYMSYFRKRFKSATYGCCHKERFEDYHQLKYSLRSVSKYIPWVRKIHIVTSFNQCPSWIDTNHPKINMVNDYDIMPDGSTPTFNSHAIEANLHNIPDLSTNFIYLCDDFYFNSVLTPNHFFRNNMPLSFFRYGEIAPRGKPIPRDAYKCGIKNANNILDKTFGVKERTYIKHIAYPLNVDIYNEMYNQYSEHLMHTSFARFRGMLDVCMHSMLMPHWCVESGNGYEGEINSASYREYVAGKRDHSVGHINHGTKKQVTKAYNRMFKKPSEYEVSE